MVVNTSRMMTDGHRDNSVGERKLIWDEENRLLSVDDNGFVSNYWYDADGERTVKTSGKSDQVYVNGVFSSGSTNTAKFSLYVSPYLVANLGGRYTKHIYAGSQRIVSKVGDFASYGSDPRRIEYAGSETDGLSVDYKSKYTAQQQVIKDHYQFFDVPYNGTDNNNYADGEGFCCNDGTLEAAQAKAMKKSQSRVASRSFKAPDNYENLQFFYHPDHLGSSGFITNLGGEVIQHIEYVPFGEVFIEERNSVWNTPYLFNAKEFDEETGLYYYGARYYEPRFSLWISVDPLVELYRNISPYAYVANNPIVYTDPDGRKIDPESQKEWNDQKHHIVDKRDKLQAKINKLNTEAIKKGWNAEKLAKKIGNKQERVSGLNTVISNLAVLEESAQTYSLNSGATNNKLSYDATTGNIVISYSGTALFAHEATHAGQFEIGDIAFASNGSSLAQDVYDEVASYKAQWAYNPSSVGGLSSTNQITASWVQGIKDPTSGDQPYKPGGSANTGISSVNVNSTRDELIRAYPHQESTLRQYPANSTLKSMIPTMYTKHSTEKRL